MYVDDSGTLGLISCETDDSHELFEYVPSIWLS